MRLPSHASLLAVLFALTFFATEGWTQTCPVQAELPRTAVDAAFIDGNMMDAETLATKELSGSPSLPAYQNLVRIQLERNELSAALESAKQASAAFPASATAQALLGDAQLRAGDVAQASATYLAALKLDRCSARAHLGHARINHMVGRHLTGNAELNNAHGLAPHDSEVTLYWLDSLQVAQRGSALRALLDSSPLLAPATLEHVKNELTIIEQQKLCTAIEAPDNVKLDLWPLINSGTVARSWGLRIRLNGRANPLIELDSSVDGIVLNPDDANKADVHPLNKINPDRPSLGFVDEIQIGKLKFKNCPVMVVPAEMLANSNSVIGTSFFRDHLIHIDYVDKSLTLKPLPPAPVSASQELVIPPGEKAWSQVYIAGANVLMPTMLNSKGPYLFLLDTGIRRTVLAPGILADTVGQQRERTVNLRGTSGELIKVIGMSENPDAAHTLVRGPEGKIINVYTPFKVPVLRFAGNERSEIRSVAFDISPKSHATGLEISGIVGFNILYDFSLDINYRDSLVQVLLDQNHRYAERENRKNF